MPPASPPASVILIISLLTFRAVRAQTYTATYLPSVTFPAQSEPGQSGTNHCGPAFNQTSQCQNAYSTCPIPPPPSLHFFLRERERKVRSAHDNDNPFSKLARRLLPLCSPEWLPRVRRRGYGSKFDSRHALGDDAHRQETQLIVVSWCTKAK